MSKQQTAVEWLEQEINRRGPSENNPPKWLQELYEQAKQMEKEQIIKAHNHGYDNCEDGLVRWIAEDYYNETYNK